MKSLANDKRLTDFQREYVRSYIKPETQKLGKTITVTITFIIFLLVATTVGLYLQLFNLASDSIGNLITFGVCLMILTDFAFTLLVILIYSVDLSIYKSNGVGDKLSKHKYMLGKLKFEDHRSLFSRLGSRLTWLCRIVFVLGLALVGWTLFAIFEVVFMISSLLLFRGYSMTTFWYFSEFTPEKLKEIQGEENPNLPQPSLN